MADAVIEGSTFAAKKDAEEAIEESSAAAGETPAEYEEVEEIEDALIKKD